MESDGSWQSTCSQSVNRFNIMFTVCEQVHINFSAGVFKVIYRAQCNLQDGWRKHLHCNLILSRCTIVFSLIGLGPFMYASTIFVDVATVVDRDSSLDCNGMAEQCGKANIVRHVFGTACQRHVFQLEIVLLGSAVQW